MKDLAGHLKLLPRGENRRFRSRYVPDQRGQASMEAMAASVPNAFGKIDIPVNITGMTQPIPANGLTYEQFGNMLRVNLLSVFSVTKAVLSHMIRQQYGRIINMSSVSAKRGGGVFGSAHID